MRILNVEEDIVAGWEEGVCEAGSIEIHYIRTGGSKPPLVLLHGLAANGMCWKPVASALSEAYDVFMPDARGHGKSGAPDRGYTYENLTNDVIGFLTAMRLSGAVLLGHSMGGMTAALAAGRSESVRAVILADPTFLSPERQREVWESDVAAQHKKMLSLPFEKLLASRLKAHPNRPRELNELSVAARLQTSMRAFGILKPPVPDYRDAVRGIRCPCLLLYGDGGVVRAETVRELCGINFLVRTAEIKDTFSRRSECLLWGWCWGFRYCCPCPSVRCRAWQQILRN